MIDRLYIAIASAVLFLQLANPSFAQQVSYGTNQPNIPISSHDRVYHADQTSNTVSVYDPSTNTLLGVIPLGVAPQSDQHPAWVNGGMTPANLSPLYYGQLLVHGMGFSFDHTTLDVVSIASNSVTFIDTATNAIKHITYVGRSPHEAFFTPDDSEVWVTVRGENYIQVIDGRTYEKKDRIYVGDGPGMTRFAPDGRYGYVVGSGNDLRCRLTRIITRTRSPGQSSLLRFKYPGPLGFSPSHRLHIHNSSNVCFARFAFVHTSLRCDP
jgi:YVTN family beta-propeller protein